MSPTSLKSEFSIKKAHETQLHMSKRIIFKDVLPERIRFVAGIDVAYTGRTSIGAVAVLHYDSLELAESQTASCKTRFPYVPTLLSFREVPPAVLCVRRLHLQPDVFLADGHGFAHPYRCGFASHLGLVIGKPTIGTAKSRLFGKAEPDKMREGFTFLKHNDEVIGAVIATKSGCKPVYVSVGNMISLQTAIEIVKHCIRHNCIPGPILKAHEIATREKRKIVSPQQITR